MQFCSSVNTECTNKQRINENYMLPKLENRKMAVSILKNTSIIKPNKTRFRNQYPIKQEIEKISVVTQQDCTHAQGVVYHSLPLCRADDQSCSSVAVLHTTVTLFYLCLSYRLDADQVFTNSEALQFSQALGCKGCELVVLRHWLEERNCMKCWLMSLWKLQGSGDKLQQYLGPTAIMM